MLDQNKILFVCTAKKLPKCIGCQYKYPQIIKHTRCKYSDDQILRSIHNNTSQCADFGLAGKDHNTSCITNIKFMRL